MIKGFIVVGSATLAIALGANVPSTTNSTDGTADATVASLHSLDEALVYCTSERTLCPDSMYVGRVAIETEE